MRRTTVSTPCFLVLFSLLTSTSGYSADLLWEVENPFRLYKMGAAFALHEAAFNQTRGAPNGPLPADIIWRTERRLNDPDCRDASTPDRCAETRRARYEQSRLGWAAQTLPTVCYETNGSPRRYPTHCERRYSWGSVREDYILPDAHTVTIRLAPERLAEVGEGECAWSWRPRKAVGKAESKRLKCKDKLTIARVPFSLDRDSSGVAVSVKLPGGRELADPHVVVEDLLVVGMGDSFASGESNPDRPVTFSATREMVYDPMAQREDVAFTRSMKPVQANPAPMYGIASATDKFDPKNLPRRHLDDEKREIMFRPSSQEFANAFDKSSAQWLSRDCHRSQYGYPFRVGLQLALENRKRSVTLVSLTCSGAEVTNGLFNSMAPREGTTRVRAQFEQLSELICRTGPTGLTRSASYTLPVFKHGSTQIGTSQITMRWCPPEQRKRPVDLLLLSIGGNDVGFGALAAYAMTESAGDLAPIARLIGNEIRFGPQVSRVYLNALDKRMKAVRDALRDGFGIDPARVLQSSYEPIQFDENGALCGTQPTLGMDVHPKLKLDRARLQETANFLRDFLARIECVSSTKRRADCPAGLATGAGTGFTLMTEHQQAFTRRGLCARDPRRAALDGAMMGMPRRSLVSDEFKPYSAANHLPYASRWRLFRTPNDAFLAANTHMEGISPFDVLQPAYAGLYGGAIHPTAEAHAIVADHAMRHVRAMLQRRGTIDVRPAAVSAN